MTAPVQVGPPPSCGPTPSLTGRERRILERVALGATYKQLARESGLAEATIRGIGAGILRKLGAVSIAHAVFLACHAGILDGRPRRHGDHAGYAAHIYRGEVPCGACREGELEYRASLRANRKGSAASAA